MGIRVGIRGKFKVGNKGKGFKGGKKDEGLREG